MQYARFIGDSPDYVLNTLIDATLAKDRDFLTWRDEQAGTAAVSTPRVDTVSQLRSRNGAPA